MCLAPDSVGKALGALEGDLNGRAQCARIAGLSRNQPNIAGCDLKQFEILHVKDVANPTVDVKMIRAEPHAEVGQRVAIYVRVHRR